MFLWLTFLTGVVYPVFTLGIAQFMPGKTQGSLITSNGKVVGSLLIAQSFESDRYFWPRPSSGNFDPLQSGGSNLGPTSLKLKNLVKSRQSSISKAHSGVDLASIPSEMLYASGSGLDPHISLDAANFQFARVANARKLNDQKKKELQDLITRLNEEIGRSFLGGSCVNVLEINLAIDRL